MSNVLFSFKTILKRNPFFFLNESGSCAFIPLSLRKDDLLEVFIPQSLKYTAFFLSVALPSAWSTVLYTNAELFCFTGSHLAKPHKHSLMQFLSAFAPPLPPSFDVHTLCAPHCRSLKKPRVLLHEWKSKEVITLTQIQQKTFVLSRENFNLACNTEHPLHRCVP